ncbi:MAG: methyltransferase domain-containing protein [Proteobacteria bacterium]|nr:methyltransferase domain-containing protein [Burkholderiales bacterium]
MSRRTSGADGVQAPAYAATRTPFARGAVLAAMLFASALACAQERFSLFVGSPQFTVERMVKVAELRDGDVVADLGSGDGRIVLTSLKSNPKIRGWGVDINPELVRQANENAQQQGVADRVQFHHRNVFDADLRDVTVINMWLFPELMRLLRPKILNEARPGTRVVSNGFDMGHWYPDAVDSDGGRVLVWIVPAKVDGFWNWSLPVAGVAQRFEAIIEQRFQAAEGIARVGNRRGVFSEVVLRGEDLSFAIEITLEPGGLTRHQFTGKVRGDRIEGTVRMTFRDDPDYKTVALPWTAERAGTTAYFRPTGVATR